MQVVTRERLHEVQSAMRTRSLGTASSHIELLAHRQVLFDLLYAAAGEHDKIDDDIFTSNIREIVARIQDS